MSRRSRFGRRSATCTSDWRDPKRSKTRAYARTCSPRALPRPTTCLRRPTSCSMRESCSRIHLHGRAQFSRARAVGEELLAKRLSLVARPLSFFAPFHLPPVEASGPLSRYVRKRTCGGGRVEPSRIQSPSRRRRSPPRTVPVHPASSERSTTWRARADDTSVSRTGGLSAKTVVYK